MATGILLEISAMNTQRFDKDIFRRALVALIGGRHPEHIESLEAVERWMASGKDGLLLLGSVGTGKSTIASAICRAWQDIVTVARFYQCDLVADRIRQDESYKYEVAYQKGLIVLDDLGTESKVYGEESLPFILYRRYERNLPTVVTTNLNQEQILSKYGERVADRFRTYARIVMNYKSLRK